jgi:hypothetical protein
LDAELGTAGLDTLAATIAAREHGVISLEQLERIGIHRQGRQTRVRGGRLHRIHRGVFAVGHRGLSREGRWMAAVLAAGPGAVLSHISAGELWGMLGSRRRQSLRNAALPIHVTALGRSDSRIGIRVHRTRTLTEADVTRTSTSPSDPSVRVGPFTVDFLWPDSRLIVEVDGYRAHSGRSAFESDRARDVELRLLGYEVVQFTWRQLICSSPGAS